jgi:hypothetical protein
MSMFIIGALLLSTFLAAVAYSFTRSSLLNQRERTSTEQAYRNAASPNARSGRQRQRQRHHRATPTERRDAGGDQHQRGVDAGIGEVDAGRHPDGDATTSDRRPQPGG